MMKKKNLFLLSLIILVISFAIYKVYNKPHLDVLKTSPDIKVNANVLFNDFVSDENNANKMYLDKVLEVNGEISDINSEEEKGIIYLKTNDDFANIMCHLSEISSQNIEDLEIGTNIVVKGICTGYLMDVVLVKTEILN